MTFDRIDTLVRSAGTGPRTLLFVHALGTDLDAWSDVAARMPADIRCVRYDLRGHGGTPATPGDYSLEQLSGDLLAVMDRLAIARATICGISIGGLIAQRAALDAPGRIDGLVLCDTALRIGSAEGWQARIDAVTARGLSAMAEEITARWYAPSFPAQNPARAAALKARLAAMSQAGYIGACAALRDADLRRDSQAIAVPTLVMSGAEDIATPPAQGRELAEAIRGAVFTELAGVGHLPCIEAPAKIGGLIESFMRETSLV